MIAHIARSAVCPRHHQHTHRCSSLTTTQLSVQHIFIQHDVSVFGCPSCCEICRCYLDSAMPCGSARYGWHGSIRDFCGEWRCRCTSDARMIKMIRVLQQEDIFLVLKSPVFILISFSIKFSFIFENFSSENWTALKN